VDVVFAFAGIDYFSHLRAFTELASLFREPERLDALRKARTAEHVLDIVVPSRAARRTP
jgi:mannitol/fructose-specific phosphotransferase system IIA component (Ntr-type)